MPQIFPLPAFFFFFLSSFFFLAAASGAAIRTRAIWSSGVLGLLHFSNLALQFLASEALSPRRLPFSNPQPSLLTVPASLQYRSSNSFARRRVVTNVHSGKC